MLRNYRLYTFTYRLYYKATVGHTSSGERSVIDTYRDGEYRIVAPSAKLARVHFEEHYKSVEKIEETQPVQEHEINAVLYNLPY